MRLLVFATIALSAASATAQAGSIVVLGPAAPPAAGEPRCVATPGAAGADLECVVTLPVSTDGAGSPAPNRILIRTIFTEARCASSQPQVVQMRPEPIVRGLPVVEHAPPRQSCPS
ncbi:MULTISPECIES: hypothetical protein [unclassified Phenylobacterium]|uniref:hypothetical protein n=1 Tax=unclassified Phenylobacterium TaxID=2640670 RepID=UPI00083AD07B|nr:MULTISPECIES: hypothetical protein [unclassified Phenylobacterium]